MNSRHAKSDARLVRAYLAGDPKAFRKLYQRYERPLFAFLLRLVRERESAEDLFQQTWMKVISGLKNYEERGTFSSWLFGIAYHGCVDHARKASRNVKDDLKSGQGLDCLPGDASGPEEQMIQREKLQWLYRAIDQLPSEQREVLLMRLNGEIPFREIAEIMQCPLNTVLGRMHYAVQSLKRMIPHESWEEKSHVLS
ncbi:MAG TPA: sigma-70 family RNA polymerase sigma factor [bacterium]|nr:sigma-70 family RNA polymerase sigma factor [bacterium]